MYKKISDYGIIGNLRTAALVGLDGSIDWLCLPFIDSPSVFGRLLDDEKGGCFSITPRGDYDSTALYEPGTNILKTVFRTRTGVMEVTDFMPIHFGCEDEPADEVSHLLRLVEVKKGRVLVKSVFEPRFDYARADASLAAFEGGVEASAGRDTLVVASTLDYRVTGQRAEALWELEQGQKVYIHLRYGEVEPEPCDATRAEDLLGQTARFWRAWLEKSETGRTVELGPWADMVQRSALVLKLLYYSPTGAMAAAATTSLPEEIGGVRNWDYRYTWIRDTSFTLQALFNLGHLSETEGYLRWIENLLSEHGADRIRIMYGLRGEEDLTETELDHLDGYKGSKPVRIGNAAAGQRQLDIYGELMDAAMKLSDYVGKIDLELWPFLGSVCDHVVETWHEPDSGIWEVRGGPHHFVYSKVMCWVALDRGVTIARRYGFPADLEKWERARGEIKAEVLDRGWCEEKRAFVQHYGTKALDASNLLLPLLGFLPWDDDRVASNMEATVKELSREGFLHRYLAKDGLPGDEGAFLLCTFWHIDNLIGLGRLEEAERLLVKARAAANHLGLFPEQYDVAWREALGNFPQAFTHIGFINSVIALMRAKGREARAEKPGGKSRRPGLLLARRIVLNHGEPREKIPPSDMARRLKHSMNILRGAFFDTPRGRVAYEEMAASRAYEDYVELSHCLKDMDLAALEERQEKIAFWINLYNVIVIHGVVELGIEDSVKEVRNFFRRVQYRIGDMFFSPDDMEHGILRGNARPANSLFRIFGRGDPRLQFVVSPVDPRVHFALVCASSSCPPIAFYTPENLEEELNVAAGTFLNSGGAVVDTGKKEIFLSRIFKWYGPDFGESMQERLRFVAGFLYDKAEEDFLMEHAPEVKVTYQNYDWRLNRY